MKKFLLALIIFFCFIPNIHAQGNIPCWDGPAVSNPNDTDMLFRTCPTVLDTVRILGVVKRNNPLYDGYITTDTGCNIPVISDVEIYFDNYCSGSPKHFYIHNVYFEGWITYYYPTPMPTDTPMPMPTDTPTPMPTDTPTNNNGTYNLNINVVSGVSNTLVISGNEAYLTMPPMTDFLIDKSKTSQYFGLILFCVILGIFSGEPHLIFLMLLASIGTGLFFQDGFVQAMFSFFVIGVLYKVFNI